MSSRWIVTLALLALAGCGSVGVEGVEFGGPPRAARMFPSQSLEGIVFAQARYTDHVADFGLDLIEEAKVVPIRLSVQLRGRGAGEAQIMLSPARMHLQLVLPDGAELQAVTADEVAKALDDDELGAKVRNLAFRGDLLGEKPIEGYVFFSLRPPTEFAMSGRIVRHGDHGVVRSLDLADSLLSFNVSTGNEGKQTPFFVGIAR